MSFVSTDLCSSHTSEGLTLEEFDGAFVLKNENTTVGYVSYSCQGRVIDYIFVNPAYRRQGYARRLVELCTEKCKGSMEPAAPISPLGEKLFAADWTYSDDQSRT